MMPSNSRKRLKPSFSPNTYTVLQKTHLFFFNLFVREGERERAQPGQMAGRGRRRLPTEQGA